MSEQDSFIDEVTDEVRRDKLFATLKRYGWIAVAVVVLIVGGAAWNEYQRAQAASAAQARGDTILAGLQAEAPADRANAIAEAGEEGDLGAVISLLAAGQSTPEDGLEAALERLEAVSGDTTLAPVYRDLATYKLVLMSGDAMEPAARIERLSLLTAPGAPYRILALELTAMAHVDAGTPDEAISVLRGLLEDAEASQGLRQRASQMIVSLGGEVDGS